MSYPNGQQMNYVYDDFGQLVSSSSNDTGTTRTVFDSRGVATERLEQDASRTAMTYDRALRLLLANYDADHPTTFSGDTYYYWDVIHSTATCPTSGACSNTEGHLAQVDNDILSGSSLLPIFFGYDLVGRQTYEAEVISSNPYETTYTYDSAGRLTDIHYPLRTDDTAHYTYDLSGSGDAANFPANAERITAIDDVFGPHSINLVNRIEHGPDGTATAIWYHQYGSGSRPTNPSISRTQRADHSLDTVVWRTGANTTDDLGTYTYGYGNDGSITSISTSSSSTSNYYRYDSLGHLTCAAGSNPGTSCSTSSTDLIDLYSYDNSGNRLTAYSPASGSGSHTFSYPSGSNRMSSWSRSDWTTTPNVNFVWPTIGTNGLVTYGSGGGGGQRIYESRSAGDGNAAYSRTTLYFPNGRLRKVGVSDARGSSTVVNSAYDHRGRRVYSITSTPSGATTDRYFFYDLRDHLIAVLELPQTGNSTQEFYFWNETEPMFRLTMQNFGGSPTQLMHLYNDHLGTPRIGVTVSTSMSSPSVAYRAPRGPFMEGSPVTQTGRGVNLRFPGQWVDEGTAVWGTSSALVDSQFTDLVNNHAREYEPGYGGYSAADPLLSSATRATISAIASIGDTAAPFSYATGAPVNRSDPRGEDPAGDYRACHAICDTIRPFRQRTFLNSPMDCVTQVGAYWICMNICMAASRAPNVVLPPVFLTPCAIHPELCSNPNGA